MLSKSESPHDAGCGSPVTDVEVAGNILSHNFHMGKETLDEIQVESY